MPDPTGQTLLFGPTGVPAAPSGTPGSIGGGVKPLHPAAIVIDMDVRKLCRRRYPLHPKGCPNYGKRPSCPPARPPITDVISLDPSAHRPVWLAWNEFDLAGHVARMKERHPGWSDRQAACVLYWQQTARRALRLRIKAFMKSRAEEYEDPALVVVDCPEACGVNVTETARAIGLELEWPPVRVARQVALIGYRTEAT